MVREGFSLVENEVTPELRLQGELYTDGSCFPQACSSLSRAGWAVVEMLNQQVQQAFFGPVIGPVPQTAQGGEWEAFAKAGKNLGGGPSWLHIDCKGVVDAAKKKEAKSNLQYVGHLRSVLAAPTAKHMEGIIKVKAHVDSTWLEGPLPRPGHWQ